MTRTFCAVIADPAADTVLSSYGEVMAAARHWTFKQVHVLGQPVAQVKREAILRFGITARQFNGVCFDLDQAVEGWKGTAKFTVQKLKDAIEATEARIAALGRRMAVARTERRRATLRFGQVGKKRRLDVLRGRLAVAERELAEGRARICFGGRDALRHGDVWAWRARRAGRILLVGSKSEGPHGNQSAHWDEDRLTLRMPDALGGGRKILEGVRFRFGQAEMLRVLERNRDVTRRVAVTWLVFRDDAGRWHAHATVDEPVPEKVTDVRNGVVAVDLNVDHLAVVLVDRHGNPTSRLRLDFPPSGTDEGRAAVIIGDAVRALCLLARSRGYGVVCERLDFSRRKAGLREYGAAHARRLSGWAYAKFFQVLEARCARDGVDLVRVDPAFTSVIGRMRYARGRAMTPHHAAALVIGRRAMGYGERLVSMDGVRLDGPARNRPRTDGRRWRGARRPPREAGQGPAAGERNSVPSGTAGSGAGMARRGGPKGPAPATARTASGGCPGASGRSTRRVPPQVGGAVAPAAGVSALADTADT